MALISVSQLTFCYPGSYDDVFHDVSFDIDSDWKLGFIGRNGRGKTTFLNLLLGKYEHQGSISSPIAFDYFPFDIQDKKQLTIDIIYSIHHDLVYWQICKEISLLSLAEDVLHRPFHTLSMGEQTKIMLAVLFLKPNKFLLIDEPTNHLDMEGRMMVSEYLNSKKGFILVSHDKDFLDGCIDHVLSINNSSISVTSGDYSTWYENKLRQDNYEMAKNKKLKGEIKSMGIAAKQTAQWSDKVEASKSGAYDKGKIGHLAARMMKRSMATLARRNRIIEEKSKLLKNIETADPLKIMPLFYNRDYMVRLRDVSIMYHDKSIFKQLDLTIRPFDRIALIGRNGCGKTSILKLILGEDMCYTGDMHIRKGFRVSYVSQDTSHLSGGLKEYCTENDIEESLFKTILRKLDLERVQFEKNMEDYSEGQKKKVLLARSLATPAHLYIWDEPLNYIDILSRTQIEDLILRYQPTMLFVEHDVNFVNTVATEVIEL
ncbi:MAG: ABC-F type ribosomal protection protein [Clostridiales bacterium]|nr:ABC-F type ribosomal protection protein [Clostridiales bacterium]